jgi:hypothetical protein
MCSRVSDTRPDDSDPLNVKRRRFVEYLLGTGLVASVISFLYPVLRFIVPPVVANLGSDSVVAGTVGELKVNSGQDLSIRKQAGNTGPDFPGRIPGNVRCLHTPGVHGTVSRGPASSALVTTAGTT